MNALNIALNVKRLAKDRRTQIGLVEDAVGLSHGYFSRCRKNSTKNISVQTLIKLSEFFGVSIDTLVSDPPVKTNADKFFEVFGIGPFSDKVFRVEKGAVVYTAWWDEPYEEKE